ncbi:flagellar protein FliT [Caloramator australicus]|uniref:Flagellar protein FliT n=1 Tax=Caloramator australicus RC3 TaxID=857293 RepID=I7LH57_9CLOT|nr:flagellar protein FliT [Caloramator australicus]CCJ33791.1 hypothetical protein CAAU_1707 [Caloramator australicus RC3]
MDAFDILAQYKNISLEILKALSDDEFDNLDTLLDKRQALIDILNNKNKNQIKKIIEDLNLLELETKIQNLLNEKLQSLRNQLKNFNEKKSAAKAYTNKENLDSIFLNKKF